MALLRIAKTIASTLSRAWDGGAILRLHERLDMAREGKILLNPAVNYGFTVGGGLIILHNPNATPNYADVGVDSPRALAEIEYLEAALVKMQERTAEPSAASTFDAA